jgi:RNA polymerase sigma-70 factor (ECF subfamily)
MTEKREFNIHQELINRSSKGDRKAQEELYRLYYRAMYSICLRILNDPVEAEDTMQEAFLAAFIKLGQYRGEMSFGSWLKRIVINKAIDILRTKRIRFEELDEKQEYDLEPDPELDDSPEETASLIRRIKDAVRNLPEGFRVVLTLSLFEGYDHEEIAMILGISESTSRSQLARAKKKLIEYLKKVRYEKDGRLYPTKS